MAEPINDTNVFWSSLDPAEQKRLTGDRVPGLFKSLDAELLRKYQNRSDRIKSNAVVDMMRGTTGAPIRLIQETLNTAVDVSNAVFNDKIEPFDFKKDIVSDPRGSTGKFIEHGGAWLGSFFLTRAGLGKAKFFQGGKVNQYAKTLSAGAVADVIAYKPEDGNLSFTLKQMFPDSALLDNPVLDYLITDPVKGLDGRLEARLKGGLLEGGLLGAGLDATFMGLKWAKTSIHGSTNSQKELAESLYRAFHGDIPMEDLVKRLDEAKLVTKDLASPTILAERKSADQFAKIASINSKESLEKVLVDVDTKVVDDLIRKHDEDFGLIQKDLAEIVIKKTELKDLDNVQEILYNSIGKSDNPLLLRSNFTKEELAETAAKINTSDIGTKGKDFFKKMFNEGKYTTSEEALKALDEVSKNLKVSKISHKQMIEESREIAEKMGMDISELQKWADNSTQLYKQVLTAFNMQVSAAEEFTKLRAKALKSDKPLDLLKAQEGFITLSLVNEATKSLQSGIARGLNIMKVKRSALSNVNFLAVDEDTLAKSAKISRTIKDIFGEIPASKMKEFIEGMPADVEGLLKLAAEKPPTKLKRVMNSFQSFVYTNILGSWGTYAKQIFGGFTTNTKDLLDVWGAAVIRNADGVLLQRSGVDQQAISEAVFRTQGLYEGWKETTSQFMKLFKNKMPFLDDVAGPKTLQELSQDPRFITQQEAWDTRNAAFLSELARGTKIMDTKLGDLVFGKGGDMYAAVARLTSTDAINTLDTYFKEITWVAEVTQQSSAIAMRSGYDDAAIKTFKENTKKILREVNNNDFSSFSKLSRDEQTILRDINQRAIEKARINTFQNDLTPWLKRVEKVITYPHPAVQIARVGFLPFFKTPMNILRYTFDQTMSPISWTWQKNFREQLLGQQGKAAQGLAQAKLAYAGATYIGLFSLWEKGWLIGRYNQDSEILREEGPPEFSIYIPWLDKYVSYRGYDPIATPLIWSTEVFDRASRGNEEGVLAAFSYFMMSFAHPVLEQPMISGVRDVFNAISGEVERDNPKLTQALIDNKLKMLVPLRTQQSNLAKLILDQDFQPRLDDLEEKLFHNTLLGPLTDPTPKINRFGEVMRVKDPRVAQLLSIQVRDAEQLDNIELEKWLVENRIDIADPRTLSTIDRVIDGHKVSGQRFTKAEEDYFLRLRHEYLLDKFGGFRGYLDFLKDKVEAHESKSGSAVSPDKIKSFVDKRLRKLNRRIRELVSNTPLAESKYQKRLESDLELLEETKEAIKDPKRDLQRTLRIIRNR